MSHAVVHEMETRRRRSRALIGFVIAGGLAVMIAMTVRVISRPEVPAACRVRYAAARSLDDTARVDVTTPPGKAMQRCGFYRQLRDLRQS
jgi:hypothetical protein